MKNNRQIGLDGKSFVSNCLKKSSFYVFGFLIFGLINAFADILKLTGRSGEVMSSLTTTLIVFDFVVSLLLVVVTFYAYFLECGANIPVLREKPIVVLCYCRLAYNVLLCYYIVYRAMYCLMNFSQTPFGVLLFYMVYMVMTFLSIFACCFIVNILERNIIRRSYIRTFHTLTTVGIIFSILMPLTYIIARFWIKQVDDQFFTASFCDLLRLCIAPIFYACIWFIFIRGRDGVVEVFNEVDSAIRDKRYSITYTEVEEEEPKRKGLFGRKKIEDESEQVTVSGKPLPVAAPAKPAALPAAKKSDAASAQSETKSSSGDSKKSSAPASSEKKSDSQKPAASTEKPTETVDSSSSAELPEEVRAAAAVAVAKSLGNTSPSAEKKSSTPKTSAAQNEETAQEENFTPSNANMTVAEYDPYAPVRKPAGSRPPQKKSSQNGGKKSGQHSGKRPPQGSHSGKKGGQHSGSKRPSSSQHSGKRPSNSSSQPRPKKKG